jgi:hypothetical protein
LQLSIRVNVKLAGESLPDVNLEEVVSIRAHVVEVADLPVTAAQQGIGPRGSKDVSA